MTQLPTPTDSAYLRESLEKLRGRLLDTTRRNRLLNYRESARDIPIIDEMPDRVFESLFQEEGRFSFQHINSEEGDAAEEVETDRVLPESRSIEENLETRYTDKRLQTPFSERELEKRLRKLYLQHRSRIDETGANSLFLAIGFLHWNDASQEKNDIKSPLILLPVQLEKKRGYGPTVYRLSFDDEALDSNYSLLERLKHDFGISLPPVTDEVAPEQYWQRVGVAIASRQTEGWRVAREMSLGLFQFHKQIMWHDLDPDRWPGFCRLTERAIVRRLLLGPQEKEPSAGLIQKDYANDNEHLDLPMVLDADSSQFSAVIEALKDKSSLIVEGPPGTGKSQTIVNLIAAALSGGKTILFVAEKMAALEVVFRRLDQVGLGDFCLQLHGLKTSKKALLESVRKRIDKQGESVTSLHRRKGELSAAREKLLAVSDALMQKVGPENLPLHEVIWRVERLRDELPDGFKPIQFEGLANLDYQSFVESRNLLEDLANEWEQINPEAQMAWQGFLPKDVANDQDHEIFTAIRNIRDSARVAQAWLAKRELDQAAPTLSEVQRIRALGQIDVRNHLPDLPRRSLVELAHNIANKGDTDEYQELLAWVSAYLEHVANVDEVIDYQDEKAEQFADCLEKHLNVLTRPLLSPNVLLDDLPTKRDDVARILGALEGLPASAKSITTLLDRTLRTRFDFSAACGEVNKFIEGPEELMLHAHPQHAHSATPALLSAARSECQRLIKRRDELRRVFRLEATANARSLQKAYEHLNTVRDRWLPPLGREYRASKRTIRSLLKNKKDFSRQSEFVDRVAQLIDFYKDRELFLEDSKDSFGTLFKGLQTDWETLESLVAFSQMLRRNLGSEQCQAVLSDWSAHYEGVSESVRNVKNVLAFAEQFAKEYGFPESLWKRPILAIVDVIRPWPERIDAAISELSGDWCSTHVSLERIQSAIEHFHQAKDLEAAIEDHAEFEMLLKPAWNRAATELDGLRQLESWFDEILGTPGVHWELLRAWFPAPDANRRELILQILEFAKGFREKNMAWVRTLQDSGDIDLIDWLGGRTGQLDHLAEKMEACMATRAYLPHLVRWSRIDAECLRKNLGAFSHAIIDGYLVRDQAGPALEYSIYTILLQYAVRADRVLANFSAQRHENLKSRFCVLDKEVLELNARKISSDQCGRIAPAGNRRGRVREFTDIALLLHESGKKRRHIPIRQLVRRASDALQTLKPCFLMSPLSVAQYLPPGEIEFDLVVMDEASQIRPEDALGALARARKAIIVGDPKQLPPTSFFQGTVIEDDDAEETIADDAESILDVCLKQFPYRRLRWHYRSNHEDLIRFSNEKFYEGDLIVFPSYRGTDRSLGVHLTKIEDPSYSRGRNRNEATVVVDNVIRHVQQFPQLSLGVAALNRRQAEEIQALLDNRRKQDSHLDHLIANFGESHVTEPLFIKNLENVQGDERHVIFISTTYGPEKPGGRVYQRFGPINSDLGWRRLNVIATRARDRVEVSRARSNVRFSAR